MTPFGTNRCAIDGTWASKLLTFPLESLPKESKLLTFPLESLPKESKLLTEVVPSYGDLVSRGRHRNTQELGFLPRPELGFLHRPELGFLPRPELGFLPRPELGFLPQELGFPQKQVL